jgi:hypothetical protein
VDADTMSLRSPPADILRSIMAHRGEA